METVGRINSISEHNVDWVIPNFSSFPEEDGKCYDSPTFPFFGHSWNLRIFPHGEKIDNSIGYIDLFLERKSSGPQINLDFSLSLRNSGGKKVEEEHFKKSFKNAFDRYGVCRFIPKYELLHRKAELLPHDVLTVICTLKYPESIVNANKSSISGPSTFHKTTILQDLKQLFLSQEHCDVVFKVKEQKFLAHKAILAARSPVFASTFRHNMKEKETGIVNIEDFDPSIFSDFLHILYSEDTEILSKQNILGLFTAADKYGVPYLKTMCVEFMKENLFVDTFCETISLALLHNKAELIHSCTEFFVKNAPKILETDKWQSFETEYPKQSKKLRLKYVSSAINPNI